MSNNFDDINLSEDNNQDSKLALSEKMEMPVFESLCDISANSISPSSTIKLDNKDSEFAMSELIEENEQKNLRKSRSHSRSVSVNSSRNGDNNNSLQKISLRKRKRSSSASRSSSPNRKIHCGRHRSRHPTERDSERHSNSVPDNQNPSRCLGVFGLSWDTRNDDLRKIFSKYGEIEKIMVIRRFGFVYYENIEDAKLAKEQCRGIQVNGKIIRLDYSRTEQPRSSDRSKYNNSRNRSSSQNDNFSRKSGSPRYYNQRRRS